MTWIKIEPGALMRQRLVIDPDKGPGPHRHPRVVSKRAKTMVRSPIPAPAFREASRLRELSAQCLDMAETSHCADVRAALLEMALEHEITLKAVLQEQLRSSPDLVRLPGEPVALVQTISRD